jgi:pimeloyl-ACP methyl ester carboxylesterase
MGMPNSRLLYEPWQRAAERQAIRLISYDRPGYGGSDPDPGRSVASGAGDVRTIAPALGIERLAVWGMSGGGPYALACAALLPDLVAAVAVFCARRAGGVVGCRPRGVDAGDGGVLMRDGPGRLGARG